MDHTTLWTLITAAVTAIVATAYGALPERIDITFVFAAYGAGTVVGDLLARRLRRRDSGSIARRWGVLFMGLAAGLLVLGLILRW